MLKVGADYYVLASSVAAYRATRTLAEGETFAVFELGGDFAESPLGSCGLFHRDARHLSRIEMRIAAKPAVVLNSYLSADNAELFVNLTNPDLYRDAETVWLPRGSVQIERSWALSAASLFGRVRLRNFSRFAILLEIKFLFGADFADLFEVRGVKRKRRGKFFDPVVAQDSVRLCYRGRDNQTRTTLISFAPTPDELQSGSALFSISLDPEQSAVLDLRVGCSWEAVSAAPPRRNILDIDGALNQRRTELADRRAAWARITTSSAPLNALIERSIADLTTIVSLGQNGGTFFMAGIPWFATLFGRDSILTALSVLPFNPEIASGTLQMLAALQGTRVDDTRDEQPGKIIHEMRLGEMSAVGEVPFARYYGSVDSTPLFLWLLGSYVEATADIELAEQLWPAAERALEWIKNFGDRDGDGFVEYYRKTSRGLANQGWKDSFDAISHADGQLARAPIALAEVQGYVFAAYRTIAQLAQRLGRPNVAAELLERAGALQENFVRHFWIDGRGTVALALDCDKRPCQVVASNAGHCLAVGLLDPGRAAATAERLLFPEMFSGWGVRTLARNERRYNPMSYHNGSVWPHDNAFAAAGLARAGEHKGVHQILEGLVQAAVHLKTGSLPELFCGLPRQPGLEPVPYPVACQPQAWSAASIFLVLSSMLGLQVAGRERQINVISPSMPEWLDWIKIENLKTGGDESVSVAFERTEHAVGIEVLEKRGASVDIKFN
ncbi:MAG TPA: glycogen debranching N-terminal domain-containing protein [Candidatus Binataceae bacterium]|nr:glycogen debranching N-terminal domain-containing protein [Candidatus Binataceae bacterium]